MKHHIAVVHQESGSAFGIHFPDIPGCFSAADELDELLRNASEAIALHLEDETLPIARSMDEIRRDSQVKADLDEGAFLIAAPIIELAGRSAKANITMDAGLLNAIDDTASSRGLTGSAFLADLARWEISRV